MLRSEGLGRLRVDGDGFLKEFTGLLCVLSFDSAAWSTEIFIVQ